MNLEENLKNIQDEKMYGGKMMEGMTDRQLEVLLNLVADKFQSCKNMEEIKKAIQEVREMANKDNSEE